MDLHTSYQLLNEGGPSTPTKGKRKATGTETDAQKGWFLFLTPMLWDTDDELSDDANKTFNALLKTELFGPSSIDNSPSSTRPTSLTSPSTPSLKPLFSFSSPSRKRTQTAERERVIGLDSPTHERYSLSPVRYESQKLLLRERKGMRQLSKVPFKVLDAPELAVRFFF